ncbi:unnamed protein product [Ectocarpus sp. CCAP 1310/34]|nr:unnamed protein product [Ectocarpus sp. CCAP 1310/34]
MAKTKKSILAERVMIPAIPKREDLVNKELPENFLPAHWLTWLSYGPLGTHADEDISFLSSNGPDLEGLSDGGISEDDNDGGGGEFEVEDASGYASPSSSLEGNSSGDTGEGTLRMEQLRLAQDSSAVLLQVTQQVVGVVRTMEEGSEADRRKKNLANLETLEKLYRDMGNEAKAKEYLMQRVAILESSMAPVGGSGAGAAGVPTSRGVDVTEGVHGGSAGEGGDVIDVDLSGGTNGNRSDNEASQETASVWAGAVQAARNHTRVRGGPRSAATTGAAAKYFASRRATFSGPAAAAAAAANNAANVLAVDSSDSDADGGGNDDFVMHIDGE